MSYAVEDGGSLSLSGTEEKCAGYSNREESEGGPTVDTAPSVDCCAQRTLRWKPDGFARRMGLVRNVAANSS
jgi:hypothetical protein